MVGHVCDLPAYPSGSLEQRIGGRPVCVKSSTAVVFKSKVKPYTGGLKINFAGRLRLRESSKLEGNPDVDS